MCFSVISHTLFIALHQRNEIISNGIIVLDMLFYSNSSNALSTMILTAEGLIAEDPSGELSEPLNLWKDVNHVHKYTAKKLVSNTSSTWW